VKQIAEDFKAGLWTFVEDLRQATVGEEPISGYSSRLRAGDVGSRASPESYAEDQDTIRASGAPSRPRASAVFDETPTPASRFMDVQTESRHRRTSSRAKNLKRFSWTPLTVDAYDDEDWSNWDSPTVKSKRWSGTTVNGDVIPSIPEKGADSEGSLYVHSKASFLPPTLPNKLCQANQQSRSRRSSPGLSVPGSMASASTTLEEMLPPMLNRLTPSNLKRTASEFMKEWERSLSVTETPDSDTENTILVE
jgi:hypothetical protein